MKHYLQRLRRHKRIIAAARLAGVVVGYGLMYLFLAGIIVGIGSLGWFLLTGGSIASLGQVVGLLLLVLLSVLATELLRPRNPHGPSR